MLISKELLTSAIKLEADAYKPDPTNVTNLMPVGPYSYSSFYHMRAAMIATTLHFFEKPKWGI